MRGLLHDLRFAARGLSREPGFVLATTLALALGIGANTAIFSVVEAVLLRPLPFPDADRLVSMWDVNEERSLTHVPPSPGNFVDWERDGRGFTGMAIWYQGRGTVRTRDAAEVVQTVKTTPGFFDVLGVPALLGHTYRRGSLRGAAYDVGEGQIGGDRALVVSAGYWKRSLAADPNVVGRTISFDGAEWQVLGVMPERFALLTPTADVYVPWDIVTSYGKLPAGTPRDFRFVNVIARLADGATAREAEAGMRTLAAALAEAHPKENKGWSVRIVPLVDELRGPVKTPLLLLFGATSFVLLVACLNAAGLQVARAAARARDTAVRAALGASAGQLFRRALIEGVLLAGLGAAAGLAVAYGGLRLLVGLQPWELPTSTPIALDGRVLLFTLATAAGTALLFAAAPRGVRAGASLLVALGQGSRTSAGRDRQRLRRSLVALQVAATLVLLTGAGLFARSFAAARAARPGFDPESVLVARISLDKATYQTGGRASSFYVALMSRLSALPGVVSAGGVTALPMSKVGVDFARPYWKEGEPDPGGQAARAAIRMATPRYFETLRMPLLRGRAFTDADRRGSPFVIAVNQTLAHRAFGDEDPIGKHLVIDYKGGAYPYEIVALLADTRFGGLKSEPIPELFIPHLQNAYLDMNVVVRTRQRPEALAAAFREAVHAIDPTQPVHSILTMETLIGDSIATDRFLATLFAFLAAVALVLSATGIYGLLAYLVRRRAHELGVRQALGATPKDVFRLVLAESARLAVAGALLGGALSLALSRLASRLLFHVSPGDPLTLVAVAAFLGVVVLLASAVPARAASRIDPIAAVRAE